LSISPFAVVFFALRRRRDSRRRAMSPNISVWVGCGWIASATWSRVRLPATIITASPIRVSAWSARKWTPMMRRVALSATILIRPWVSLLIIALASMLIGTLISAASMLRGLGLLDRQADEGRLRAGEDHAAVRASS
jgi:hypothetical protein